MADVADAKSDPRKYVVITGGNQGIGLLTAIKLCGQGYVVTISARTDEKGKDAIANIIKLVPEAKVDYLLMDLLSLDSVRNFAKAYLARSVPLHVLINNAGIMCTPFMMTRDNIEAQFQVNHLSHFLLTYLLWPRLLSAGAARVINVASKAHFQWQRPLDIQAVRNETLETYHPMAAYGRSKIANILFTTGLQRRLKNRGVTFFSLHPGLVSTNLLDVAGINSANAIPVEDGCKTSVFLATTPDIEKHSGGYFFQCAPSSDLTAWAQSTEEANKLWEGSLLLLGLTSEEFA
jgi:NAD(P)-dependent dehydrogenase (short-subunit alcohol dehydrogenase family)